MDWTQTLTIIFTIISSMIAVWYAFYHIIKEDINLIRADIKRHDVEFQEVRNEFREMRQETRNEFKEVHALWASLLEKICGIEKQIYEIKLDQSKKA